MRLGRLIRISDKRHDLQKDCDDLLANLRKNNALLATIDPEMSEHLARLDMGRNLVGSEHVYPELIHLFLLASLRWIYPKIAHQGLLFQIQRLMDSTIVLLEEGEDID